MERHAESGAVRFTNFDSLKLETSDKPFPQLRATMLIKDRITEVGTVSFNPITSPTFIPELHSKSVLRFSPNEVILKETGSFNVDFGIRTHRKPKLGVELDVLSIDGDTKKQFTRFGFQFENMKYNLERAINENPQVLELAFREAGEKPFPKIQR